ncbi:MAG: FG-GAP-like repeat-containing protein, partial [Acidimicrobiales bacterium]
GAATAPIAGGRTIISTGGNPWGADIADVTGDGRDDLIVTNWDGPLDVAFALSIYPQAAGGTLATNPTVYHLSSDPDTPWYDWLDTAVGDLNDDGKLDVVVGRFDGLEIFRQSGGVLQAPVVVPAIGAVEEIHAVDLDGNGMDDLVYADRQDDQYRIMRRLQGPAGTFGAAVEIATPAIGRFSVGDVNTDGRPDILVEDPWAVEVQVLVHNPGNQGFTSTSLPASYTRSTSVADVNGDGHNDVLALHGGVLRMFAGKADGSLKAPVEIQQSIYGGSSVDTADMNSDGRTDILVFSQGNLDVLLQTETGDLLSRCPLPSLTPRPVAGWGSETAVGDLDGDGRLDAVAVELDDGVYVATQIAPGSSVSTTLTLDPMSTTQIGDPVSVHAILEAGAAGCLDNDDVDVWRQLPGEAPELLTSVSLGPYSDASWQFGLGDDPGVLGTVNYRAVWAGDAFRDPSQSAWVPVEITKRATSLTLGASDTDLLVGDTTTMTASLQGGAPGSDVTFSSVKAGVSTPVATAVVDGAGTASIDVSPRVTTTYVATYAGDSIWVPATSPQFVVHVSKHPTSIKLRARPGFIGFGADTTLTATLAGGGIDREVRFFSLVAGRQKPLGTVAPDADGVATLDVAPKVHTRYIARYPGDATWAAANSGKELVQVHLLATGGMTRYLRRDGAVAVYRCCSAYYAFKVKPNYAGEIAAVKLEANGPDGWEVVATGKFRLRRDSSIVVKVRISGAAGHTFRLYGCLRDQPDRRGSCARARPFTYLGAARSLRSTTTVARMELS